MAHFLELDSGIAFSAHLI